MSIREEKPVEQSAGARNAGGDLQTKGISTSDIEVPDRTTAAETTAGPESAEQPNQQT